MAKEGAHRRKFDKVMEEYKEGELHSGSKEGPKVTNPKQAVAIAYSEAKKDVRGERPSWLTKRRH